MPINNNLPDLKSPVKNRHGERPSTKSIPHLESIKVTLMSAPTMRDLIEYIPEWGTATWRDKPEPIKCVFESHDILKDMFDGNLLPSAMETINLVFLISNIDLIDVTHLLRHRTMSFSAICSADRDMRHDDCLVKESIRCNSPFYIRYLEIVAASKELYADMVDSEDVSLLDARTILPRCLEHHYYCRVNLKDAIHFIKQRVDRQIQPESDNIIAIQMYYEICKQFPMFKGMIDLDSPDSWYVKTAPTGRSSNIYMPEKPRNDIFEHKEQWFMYKKERKDMPGGKVFTRLWNKFRILIKGVL